MAIVNFNTDYNEELVTETYANDIIEFSEKPWSSNQKFVLGKYGTVAPSTVQSLYLLNLNTKEEIVLKLVPQSLAEQYSARLTQQSTFGILKPLNFYSGGTQKSISFSFDVHEDINGIDGSLYTLVEKIKRLNLPVIKNDTIRGPEVYFQLGTQFAGKGHLKIDIEYKLPYNVVSGRYKLATITMSFVFHEEFYEEPVVLEENTLSLQLDASGIPLLQEAISSYDSVEDFLAGIVDYDYAYYVSQDFAASKLNAFLNILTNQSVVESFSEQQLLDSNTVRENLLKSVEALRADGIIMADYRVNSETIFYRNPYGITLINAYKNIESIINPVFSRQAVLSNLKSLLKTVETLSATYRNSYFEVISGYPPGINTSKEIGWYRDPAYEQRVTQMTTVERVAFENAVKELIAILKSQISLYSITYGAGE